LLTPERWQQVKEVLHQALERAPGGRVWLSDSRRLLFQDKIFLLDSPSKKVHEVTTARSILVSSPPSRHLADELRLRIVQ
jgi:ABC-type phosphate transport system ATPase subunit